jgi:hypothetical protein
MVDPSPQARERPWTGLQEELDGYFVARARGFLADEFELLRRDGRDFGRLQPRRDSTILIALEDLELVMESPGGGRYRMLAEGEEVLAARPEGRSADVLRVERGDPPYEVRTSLLRNTAVVRDGSGEEVARIRGNLSGRRYEARFDADHADALPVAILSLHHTSTLRRRAFRADR